ncbi:ceramide kinase-like isoform X1 [Haliotis asinina]|uniref:ceramide kinase-like isoform X1 n=1 Tax=Haliotis asinina TaxID=109174 RepID=UPI00353206F8
MASFDLGTETVDMCDADRVVLTSYFTLSGKPVRLEVKHTRLTWRGEGQTEDCHVDWDDVITAYLGGVSRGPGVKARVGVAPEEDRFTLHYIEHQKINILRHKHVTFIGQTGHLKEWLDIVADKVGRGRPKRLLTIVNPVGGKKTGVSLYETIVEPLFVLAGIDAQHIYTERFRHAEEVAKTFDFTSVDGLVVSGGDGLMQEVLQGLIPRYNKDLNLDDPDAQLKPLPVALGALPTGTANGISVASYGSRDVETGVLRIIQGKKRHLNIASVHGNPGALIGYSCFGVVYGRLAEMVKKTVNNRWMKTFRYPAEVVRSLVWKTRELQVDGEYLPARTPVKDIRSKKDQGGSVSPDGWVKFSGLYTCVHGRLGGFHKVEGRSKLQFDQEGQSMNLFLWRRTGRLAFFKWIIGFIKLRADTLDAECIEDRYVQAYRFRVGGLEGGGERVSCSETGPDGAESDYLVIDGEVRHMTSNGLEIRIHRHLAEFFGTTFDDWSY